MTMLSSTPDLSRLRRYIAALCRYPANGAVLDAGCRYCLTGEALPPPAVFAGPPGDHHWDEAGVKDFLAHNRCEEPAFYLRLGRLSLFLARHHDQMQDLEQAERLQFLWQRVLTGYWDGRLNGSLWWLAELLGPAARVDACSQIDAVMVQRAAVLSGADPADIFAQLFVGQRKDNILHEDNVGLVLGQPILALGRLDQAILGCWESVEKWLRGLPQHRQRALLLIGRSGLGTGAKRDLFLPCLVSPNTFERVAARLALPWCSRPVVRSYLAEALAAARPAERVEAASLLWSLDGEAARPLLTARHEAETSDMVRQHLTDLLDAATRSAAAVSAQGALVLPPYPAPDMAATVPQHLRSWLLGKLEAMGADWWYQSHPEDAVTPADLEVLLQVMDGTVTRAELYSDRDRANRVSRASGPLGHVSQINQFATHPDMPLSCYLRAVFAYGTLGGHVPTLVVGDNGYRLFEGHGHLFAAHHRFDLRTLADAFAALGGDPSLIGARLLETATGARPLLPPELIWPYFAERPEQLERALAKPPGPFHDRALMVLEMMPALSPRFVPRLLEMALYGHAAYRGRAQSLLDPLPGMHERAEAALRNDDAEVRATAAGWLKRRAQPEALPALLAAYAKERNDAARVGLVDALEACGHDTSGYFDLATQQREAARLLGKGIPKQLAWLPWHALPSLRLADGSGTVPLPVIQAWTAGAGKLKAAGGSATLRRQVQLVDAADRPALARAILSNWLDCDRSDDAAQQQFNRDHDEWTTRLYSRKHTFSTPTDPLPVEPVRSAGVANACRGILGVAAVCGDETLVAQARPVLKAWDGTKRLQIIALLEMLAAIDHPTAIQAVLAFASRHPVRTVRESAQASVQAIAAAKGWSVDELADRTVPTAGLDDDGGLVLDFGPRAFTLTLGDDLALTLRSAEGKVLKALPQPRADDDPALAAAAKSALSQVKKELKALVPQQTRRLYDGMCLEKSWPAQDWQRYIAGHPILGRMASRLVWCARADAGQELLFRPLADGSLSDADDQTVTLPPGVTIRLAHAATAGVQASAAWLRHLQDYEVTPLFGQFGRPLPPEPAAGQTTFRDGVGRVMSDAKFRDLMKKLGYAPGPAQDAGWYINYLRAVPALGVEACLFFSGSGHGVTDHEVALRDAGFLRPGEAYPSPGLCLPLDELPKILVAELYGDLLTVAAAGRIDPEWISLTGETVHDL
jgi:hypothetical protein